MVEACWALIWPQGEANVDDRLRWFSQGFVFNEAGDVSFGLQQGHGGPCGVLAAVQAEILRILVFTSSSAVAAAAAAFPTPSFEEMQRALVDALVVILERCRGGEERRRGAFRIVLSSSSSSSSCSSDERDSTVDYTVHTCEDGEAVGRLLEASLTQLHSNAGVILFLLSAILTRGVETTRSDFDDDPDIRLTSAFGHCSQELLNLLLCGRACSNVWDGDKPLGDSGLTLCGIPAKSSVGYLTHLEALRYCEVGSYYKSPTEPIWVVGSSSHFTVLFSLDRGLIHETETEILLGRVQRAFKAIDVHGSGFISVDDLSNALGHLGLFQAGREGDANAVQALQAQLQVSGAGIILWDDFWRCSSRLLTGASLEAVLANPGDAVVAAAPTTDGETAAASTGQTITEHPPSTAAAAGPQGGSVEAPPPRIYRSDSEFARELQAQFDQQAAPAAATASVPVSVPAPMEEDDDEMLRRAIAMSAGESQGMDTGSGGSGPTCMVADDDNDLQRAIAMSMGTAESSSAGGAGVAASGEQGAEESKSNPPIHDVSFDLYHYNGLQGGGGRSASLVRLTLRKCALNESCVGASVPLGTSPAGGVAFACPIEEVLRTKWPDCNIDWHGATPPSID